MDRHSQIAITPETHFITGADTTASHRGSQSHESLVTSMQENERLGNMKLDTQKLLEHFRSYPPDQQHQFRSMLELYGNQRSKRRVGEKTPQHLFSVPTIFKWYPAAKVICIVRDGRDVTLSTIKAPFNHFPDSRWAALRWRRCARLSLQYEEQFPAQFIRVHFEKLVQNPVEELTRIDQFAGVDFEPGQLDAGTPTGVVPDKEKGWIGNALKPLDAGRVFAWRERLKGPDLWVLNAIMETYLRKFDYPEPGMNDSPLLSRAMIKAQTQLMLLRYESPLIGQLKSIFQGS